MVNIKPFRGFRPQTEAQFDLFINPDIETQKINIIEENPGSGVYISNNLQIEDSLAERFTESFDPFNSRFTEIAKKFWPQFIQLNLLKQDTEPSFYVYRMSRPQNKFYKSQIGLVCLASVKDVEKGKILGHENIFEKPLNKIVNKIDKYQSSPSTVYLMYEDKKSIDLLIKNVLKTFPVINFEATTGVRHTLWKVDNPNTIHALINEFKAVEYLYIADGHHRIYGAQKYAKNQKKMNKKHTGREDYNFFLAGLFPESQLQVLDFNRIVRDVSSEEFEEFVKKIQKKFIIQKKYTQKKPLEKNSFGVYYNKKWFKITAKKKIAKKRSIIKTLDAFILQRHIFKPIFNVKNPSADKRIIYIPGTIDLNEVEQLTDKNNGIAFLLYPMMKEDIIKVAKAKKAVPPKSTWFEPKPLKGIIVRIIKNMENEI